jgi:hypothetical protein
MTRLTVLYLGMLVLLAGSFEGIRRLGNTLTPPRHISGLWHLTLPSSSTFCPILEFDITEVGDVRIEQSGRYLTLTFPDVHHTLLRARLDGGRLYGSGPSTASCAVGTEVRLSGRLNDDHLELVLTRVPETFVSDPPILALSAVRSADVGSPSPASP